MGELVLHPPDYQLTSQLIDSIIGYFQREATDLELYPRRLIFPAEKNQKWSSSCPRETGVLVPNEGCWGVDKTLEYRFINHPSGGREFCARILINNFSGINLHLLLY